jgi:catechol 2,3-dioxygenase-like lactoylglutathione lyase family enzyme
MLREIFHFSFTVSDIEASIIWYRDVLGLEFVHRQRQENEYTRQLVGMPDAIMEVAQFKVPGIGPRLSTHVIELVQYVQPIGEQHHHRLNDVGTPHIAFLVTDIQSLYDRLLAAGVRFRTPPIRIAAGVNQGGLVCYFHDPDGFLLEMQEPSAERQASLGLLE